MTTRIGSVAAGMALASPNERSRLAIPPLNRILKPILEDLHIIDMMPLQSAPDENALHGFGHIEPGASTRRVQEPNAVFMTPTHQLTTVMACQIVQNEQHAQRRTEAIQLLGCGKRIPILPAPPFWDQLRSGWTTLEDGGQFAHQPGM